MRRLRRPELLTVETMKSDKRFGVAVMLGFILFIILVIILLGAGIGRLGY